MENDQNTITELLKNESFLAWYYKTDPEQVAYWENKLNANPEIMANAEKAVALLTTIQIKEPAIPPNKMIVAEKRLLLSMSQPLPLKESTLGKQLEFENAPMGDVKRKLEAIYGIEIVFADATIASERITCMMPNDNLEIFIESLQATMVYQVYKTGNVLTILKSQGLNYKRKE